LGTDRPISTTDDTVSLVLRYRGSHYFVFCQQENKIGSSKEWE